MRSSSGGIEALFEAAEEVSDGEEFEGVEEGYLERSVMRWSLCGSAFTVDLHFLIQIHCIEPFYSLNLKTMLVHGLDNEDENQNKYIKNTSYIANERENIVDFADVLGFQGLNPNAQAVECVLKGFAAVESAFFNSINIIKMSGLQRPPQHSLQIRPAISQFVPILPQKQLIYTQLILSERRKSNFIQYF